MEYIAHMEEQHVKLRQAWDAGDRVVSLKIAIQCAKLLGEVTVPEVYPSMYVLLTAILDTFGDLVFERIKRLSVIATPGQAPQSLPANFTHVHVSANAIETCKNWFYKTACIRELMPRLFIDLALIKSYRFLSDADWASVLCRLSRTIRGVGDPLVATYARAFLATKARDLADSFREDTSGPAVLPVGYQKALLEAYDDFMFTFKALAADEFASVQHVSEGKVTKDQYIDLYYPALEWITQNIGYGGSEDLFFALMDQYREYFPNSGVLVHLISAFNPQFVSNRALSMSNLIKEAQENEHIPKSKLYLALGKALIVCSPPQDQRLPILNDVWKVVTKIQDPMDYLEIACVFVQYLLINFSEREVNIFLQDVIKHVKQCTLDQIQTQPFQTKLENIVAKTILHTKDLLKTLSMDNFLSILDTLEKTNKVAVAKTILTKFSECCTSTSDPVIIHTLFDVARSLHDSLDSMSFDDEVRQCSVLIVAFIGKIDFGRDLEQQLNIYADCRQAFTRLDAVAEELILRVALLSQKAHKLMKGKHTRKTAAFVKACLAYCHIAIPSLEGIFKRLRLFLMCGQVALVNSMVVQSEGFLKAAISLIPEVPATLEVNNVLESTEADMESYVLNFTSFLLLFPGHPTHGPFYLVQGLINAVGRYAPWANACIGKARVFMGVLALLCAYGQRNFVLHIDRVESNDSLYGGGQAYTKGLVALLDGVVTSIFEQIRDIPNNNAGDMMAKKAQCTLSLEFINLLISGLVMNKQTAILVVRLYGLSRASTMVDTYRDNTKAHIQSKRGTWYQDIYQEIVKMDATPAPTS